MLKMTMAYATGIPLEKRRQLVSLETYRAVRHLFHKALGTSMVSAVGNFDPVAPAGIRTGMSAASFVGLIQDAYTYDDIREDYNTAISEIESRRKTDKRKNIRSVEGEVIDPEGYETIDLGLERSKLKHILKVGSRNQAYFQINFAIPVYQWVIFEEAWKIFDNFQSDFRNYVINEAEYFILNKRVLAALTGKA